MESYSIKHSYRISPRNKSLNNINKRNEVDHMNAINNNLSPTTVRKKIHKFIEWYKNLIDNDQNKIGLYLSENAVLQWFGRTITEKNKIATFIKYDINCCNHVFSNVHSCQSITLWGKNNIKITSQLEDNFSDDDLAVPLDGVSFSFFGRKNLNPNKQEKRRHRSISSSPEILRSSPRLKKLKTKEFETDHSIFGKINAEKSLKSVKKCEKYNLRSSSKSMEKSFKSTDKNSGINLESIEYPQISLEATCILEFLKCRNKRGAEIHKWERSCKVQISFSDDPIYPGDYIIWTIVYSDNNKCKRNLLSAFNAVGD